MTVPEDLLRKISALTIEVNERNFYFNEKIKSIKRRFAMSAENTNEELYIFIQEFNEEDARQRRELIRIRQESGYEYYRFETERGAFSAWATYQEVDDFLERCGKSSMKRASVKQVTPDPFGGFYVSIREKCVE